MSALNRSCAAARSCFRREKPFSLRKEKSASIFKHLKEDEIEELTLEIANTRSVTPQVKEEIIDEFYEVCLAQQYIAEGGIGYAKDLLEKRWAPTRPWMSSAS